MAVRSPDPTEALVAWEAGNSIQKIARDPTPLVTGAPYTHKGVLASLRRAVTATLGAELITNGDFVTGVGWTAGAGWSFAGGVATTTGQAGELEQAVAITEGNQYLLGFDVVNVDFAGQGLGVALGTVAPTVFYTQARRNWITLTAGGAPSAALQFFPGAGITPWFIGSIDNVTLKEVNPP